jgi:hypothetical protein
VSKNTFFNCVRTKKFQEEAAGSHPKARRTDIIINFQMKRPVYVYVQYTIKIEDNPEFSNLKALPFDPMSPRRQLLLEHLSYLYRRKNLGEYST